MIAELAAGMVFDVLRSSLIPEKIREWFAEPDPKRLAFQKAMERALLTYEQYYPDFQILLSNMDKEFLRDPEVIAQLSLFFTPTENPDPEILAQCWQGYLPHTLNQRDIRSAAETLLTLIEKELKKEPALRDHFNGRLLEQLLRTQVEIRAEQQTRTQNPILIEFSSQIEQIDDEILRAEIERAVNHLTIEEVDIGLFQLAKILENSLKSFLLEASNSKVINVTGKELARFANMIDCVARLDMVENIHELQILRILRNEHAHRNLSDSLERKRLMRHVLFYADKYIEYILLFHKKEKEMSKTENSA